MAYVRHMFSPFLHALAPLVSTIESATQLLGVHEFMPNSDLLEAGGYYVCRDESPIQELCANVVFLIGGYNSEQLNRSILPDIMANTPAGASVSQIVHYGQGINSGLFRQFDYGLGGNLMKYGRLTPPEYPLELITCPIALHYSHNDWLSSPVDVELLARRLPSLIGKYLVLDPKFNHMDFVYAWGAKAVLYDTVMELMSVHST